MFEIKPGDIINCPGVLTTFALKLQSLMARKTYAQTEHYILVNRLECTEAKQQIASKTKGKPLLWHPKQTKGY